MAKDITHGPVRGLDGTEYFQDPDRQGWTGYTPKRTTRLNIPEAQPFQHIQLKDLLEFSVEMDGTYTLNRHIFTHILDTTNRAVVDAVIEWAKAEGLTDLYLLDREFVKAALLEKIARDKGTDRWIDDGPASKCPTCGFSCNDEYYLGKGNYCPDCGQRLTGLCGRED